MPSLTRIALLYLAATGVVVGVWAALYPASFYAGFPGLGRHWVSADGPYNQHLVRDAGAAYLMIAVLAALGLARPATAPPMAVGAATLAFNGPHLAYHATHMHMLAPLDRLLNVLALGSAVLASVWLLTPAAAGRRPRARRR